MTNEKRLIDAIELKPCPFCGTELVGNEEIWRHPTLSIMKKQLVYTHPKSNCVLDYHRYHFEAYPKKVKQWNRRAEDGKV